MEKITVETDAVDTSVIAGVLMRAGDEAMASRIALAIQRAQHGAATDEDWALFQSAHVVVVTRAANLDLGLIEVAPPRIRRA